jgi:thiamine pyrophosphate-dependent acetolactate synthase large subunit-like protein
MTDGVRSDRPAPSSNSHIGWGSDVAAAMLRRLDLRYVAHNPGSSFAGLHDSLVNHLGNEDPTMLLCLTEGAAVSVAHGFAKATGRPMGVILHSNVGFMNGLMAIYNAWADRVPVYLLGASGPHDAAARRPWSQWLHTFRDQAAMARHFLKWDDTPGSPEAMVESMLRANILGRTAPMGPTYINLDIALQERKLEREVEFPDMDRFTVPATPEPAREAVERAADALLASGSPLILMGRVSRREDDWARRVRLAELVGAEVCTDHKVGAQFPTDHALHLGPPGTHLDAAGLAALASADAVLALDWIDFASYLKQAFRGGAVRPTIIHAQLDSYVHNGASMDHFGLAPADVRLIADPDAVVQRVLEIVEKRLGGTPRSAPRSSRSSYPDLGRLADRDPAGPIDLTTLGVAIAEARGRHDIVLGRTSLGWVAATNHYRRPMDYLGSDGGAGVGAGPGNAIGIALGLMGTGKTALSVIGDGDLMQGVAALWTAAHYRIPALIVVVDNRTHAQDEHASARVARERGRNLENVWIGQRFSDPALDIPALARGQGVESMAVTAAGELAAALERGIAVVRSGLPFLLSVRCEPRSQVSRA